MVEQTELVSVPVAARALGISAQALHVQINAGKVPAHDGKVNIEEARAAREANLAPPRKPITGGYAAVKEHHEKIRAQTAALELATLQGKVVPRAETEEWIFEILAEVRSSLATRWASLSAELEGMTAQEIEALGTAADEAILTRLADRVRDWK